MEPPAKQAKPAAAATPEVETPAVATPEAAAVETPTVATPVVATPAPQPTQPGTLQKPTLPPSDQQGDKPARDVVKAVVPWVSRELGCYLLKHGLLACLPENGFAHVPPLQVIMEEGTDTAKMSSFKEPWVQQNCAVSITQSKCYEAGANLFWLCVECTDPFLLPGPEPSWTWCLESAKRDFKMVEGGTHGNRIRFPIHLTAAWMERSADLREAYPIGARLLGAHAYLWSWYVAMYLAMEADDRTRVFQLYESALTVTICLYGDCDYNTLALHSIQFSESIRHQEAVMVDSFYTFSCKVFNMTGKVDHDSLKRKGVRYNGAPVSATMMKAINHMKSLTPDCIKYLGIIERRWGFEVLSGNYNKMLRLMQGTANKNVPQGELLEWCLMTMLTLLDRGESTTDDFKADAFIKAKDGTPSWISTCSIQYLFVQQLATIAQNTKQLDSALGDKLQDRVLQHICTPSAYNATFPMSVVGVEVCGC